MICSLEILPLRYTHEPRATSQFVLIKFKDPNPKIWTLDLADLVYDYESLRKKALEKRLEEDFRGSIKKHLKSVHLDFMP